MMPRRGSAKWPSLNGCATPSAGRPIGSLVRQLLPPAQIHQYSLACMRCTCVYCLNWTIRCREGVVPTASKVDIVESSIWMNHLHQLPCLISVRLAFFRCACFKPSFACPASCCSLEPVLLAGSMGQIKCAVCDCMLLYASMLSRRSASQFRWACNRHLHMVRFQNGPHQGHLFNLQPS